MPKLIIEIDEKLHKAIKVKAASEGSTLRGVVTELLKQWIKGGK